MPSSKFCCDVIVFLISDSSFPQMRADGQESGTFPQDSTGYGESRGRKNEKVIMQNNGSLGG